MDKITVADIDSGAYRELADSNLAFLSAYKNMLDCVESMHNNISLANLVDPDSNDEKIKLSDNLVSELAVIAQQMIKTTFLIDRMGTMFNPE